MHTDESIGVHLASFTDVPFVDASAAGLGHYPVRNLPCAAAVARTVAAKQSSLVAFAVPGTADAANVGRSTDRSQREGRLSGPSAPGSRLHSSLAVACTSAIA